MSAHGPEYWRDAKRKSRAERAAKGLCTECGVYAPDPGHRKCADCIALNRASTARRRAERRAKSVCPECGEGPLRRWKVCDRCRKRHAEVARRSVAKLRKERQEGETND